MRDLIGEALKGHDADYVEIHFEESQATSFVYRGQRLEEISRARSIGGNVRALVKGSWGFVSFNQLDGLKEKVAVAVKEAKLASREPFKLFRTEPVADTVESQLKKDATTIPLATKKELLDSYNDIMLSSPKIQSTRINYRDMKRRTTFANSEGSYIEQIKTDLTARLTAIAREDNEIQQAGLSLGSNGEFSVVEGLDEKARGIARRAAALLSAPQVKAGEYTVILDPVLAGVFAHEAFGHLSESDHVYQNENLRQIMVLGKRFGGKHLNIVDDPTMPSLRGSYKYDDEGTPARKAYLIREGVLEGRLHSRETAAKMGETATGNARAINYHFPPIVRMSNTLIEPGSISFEQMLGDIEEGVYVKDWYGGTTSLEMFTFSAGEAYMIRRGKLAELLRPVVLTGNVFTTLENIDAIGDDLEMNQGGGCGKAGQYPLPVSDGSPHIRIRHCVVGGR
ncbi:MAG: TldD/PmbA family protein [Dehalococcoidia bacterium]|nr:TldD/PmbA family protein [Dehalococcoidia bacterium]MDH4291177.1 TldD/PmbA family protein [Dehalococcoidia bacterium]